MIVKDSLASTKVSSNMLKFTLRVASAGLKVRVVLGSRKSWPKHGKIKFICKS